MKAARRAALFALAGVGMLSACTALVPVGSDSVGSARIVEQNFAESATVAQIFHVAAIDGVPVESSLEATRRATAGASGLTVMPFERRIPARRVRLTLVATRLAATAVDEQAMRAAGRLWRVQGDVIFEPTAGGDYFIAGELKPAGSSVWIAALRTGQRVSEVVSERR